MAKLPDAEFGMAGTADGVHGARLNVVEWTERNNSKGREKLVGRKQYLIDNELDPRLMQFVQRRDKAYVVDPKYDDVLQERHKPKVPDKGKGKKSNNAQ